MANAEPQWRMRLPCLENAFGDVLRGTGHVGGQVGGDRLSGHLGVQYYSHWGHNGYRAPNTLGLNGGMMYHF